MTKPDDLSDVFAKLGKIQSEAAEKREQNRARLAAWSPKFLRLLDALRDLGMAPKLVKFEVGA